jgi:ABC-type transporter Mla maintaining outer membrane lipid asymmetry ATPase subunit MlaF
MHVSPDEPALSVDRLTKRFGERTAFSDVSFEVAYGEVFGFLGPNGAGKTTTVRTLGTLVAATSGSATVAGIPLEEANGTEIRQRISIMPESPGLYLRLSVTENLEYFAALYGLHPSGPRIKEALMAVNLADRAGDLCGALSKGLRQRVGLARTLLSDPAIMFLDVGPQPRRRSRGTRLDRRPATKGGDDLLDHPPSGRSRKVVRPGGHLEHDSADRRAARGSSLAALQSRSGREDAGSPE